MREERTLTYNGVTRTVREWATARGIPIRTLKMRMFKGWSVRDCLYGRPGRSSVTMPPVKQLTYKGETLTMLEWSKRVGVSKGTLVTRLKRGWSPRRTLFGRMDEIVMKPLPRGRHNSKYIEFGGQRLTLKEWAEKYDLNYNTVFSRYYRGCRDPARLLRPTGGSVVS